MKILTVIYVFGRGGTQRVAQVFAEAYRQLGHDSRILALHGLVPKHDALKEFIHIWHDLSETNLQEIKQWYPDIIHIHSHCPREAAIRLVLDHVKGGLTKVIETNVFSAPSPWADQVDVSFQLSVWAMWLFQLRGGREFPAALVPNPVICRNFRPGSEVEKGAFRKTYNIPQDAFLIGRIGRPAEWSWSPLLLRAFNDLAGKYNNLYLVAVGPSPAIVNGMAASPYKQRIVIIPVIAGDENLSVAYSSFDLMVHVAEGGESFGLVNAESILCGTPVVTLSTPWNSNSQCEVVGNMKGGYVVNSLGGIKKAIKHFMKNRDKMQFADKGGEHIRQNYDHLLVARKAIECALRPAGQIPDGGSFVNGRISEILTDTFDRSCFLTRILISMNNNRARKLTIYTSSYRPLYQLPRSLFKKRLRKRTSG